MRLGIYSLLLLVLLPGLSKHAPSRAAANPAASQPIDQTTDRTATDRPTTSAVRDTLFAQSAVQVLARDFSGREISYLLLDARSGALLASRWEKSSQPIPLGSLVKPFSALAYAETHDFQYPSLECAGYASGCWQMHPHGRLNIVSAISVSCNSYFRSLAESVAPEQLFAVTQAFDLESPDSRFTAASLVGLGERWKISPLRMARAYLELLRRRDHPGVHELLVGMQQSAQAGTGAAVGRALINSGALVKTGTAPCTHVPSAPADGFVIVLVPALRPEILLMIRVHGVAGATAAETAARMLAEMAE
jgi:cell division protein FtsI/penicillin-binding protein 2